MTIRTLFNDCVENKAKIINAKLSEIKFYLPNSLGIKRNYCLNMFDYLIKGFCLYVRMQRLSDDEHLVPRTVT